MSIDYSKYTTGDVLETFTCNSCARFYKFTPKHPADSGSRSWNCSCCGRMNIGSVMTCRIGDWLQIIPIGHVKE